MTALVDLADPDTRHSEAREIETSSAACHPFLFPFAWATSGQYCRSAAIEGKIMEDYRALHLGLVEPFLRRQNPDLPNLRLSAQAHYSPEGFAFVEVYGVAENKTRRRKIRAIATDMLQHIGYHVVLECGRDVYDICPERPRSRHEEIAFLSALQDLQA